VGLVRDFKPVWSLAETFCALPICPVPVALLVAPTHVVLCSMLALVLSIIPDVGVTVESTIMVRSSRRCACLGATHCRAQWM
jgi:hypothetical protein